MATMEIRVVRLNKSSSECHVTFDNCFVYEFQIKLTENQMRKHFHLTSYRCQPPGHKWFTCPAGHHAAHTRRPRSYPSVYGDRIYPRQFTGKVLESHQFSPFLHLAWKLFKGRISFFLIAEHFMEPHRCLQNRIILNMCLRNFVVSSRW